MCSGPHAALTEEWNCVQFPASKVGDSKSCVTLAPGNYATAALMFTYPPTPTYSPLHTVYARSFKSNNNRSLEFIRVLQDNTFALLSSQMISIF